MKVNSFTVDYEHEKIIVRYEDDTEQEYSYPALYRKYLNDCIAISAPDNTTIEKEIAREREEVRGADLLPDNVKAGKLAQINTKEYKKLVKQRLTNRTAATEARQMALESLAEKLNAFKEIDI